MELDYRVKPRLRQRINFRLILFLAVVCVPCAWIGYIFANEYLTHGIHKHEGYVDVNLKQLGQFPFDKENGQLTDVPKEFRELDGKRVELKGKMYAGFSAYSKVSSFEFVYDVNKCCFGGPPQVQERVFVHSSQPVPLYGMYDLVDIVGNLHVRLKREAGGVITSVYDLDLESLKLVS